MDRLYGQNDHFYMDKTTILDMLEEEEVRAIVVSIRDMVHGVWCLVYGAWCLVHTNGY